MKERLKQEIEGEAPFDIKLPEKIIAKTKRKRPFKWTIITASASVVLLAVVFWILLPITTKQEPTSLAPSEPPIIQNVTAYEVDSFKVHEDANGFSFLKSLLNSIEWDKEYMEEVQFNREPYQLTIQSKLEDGQLFQYDLTVWDFFDYVNQFVVIKSKYGVAILENDEYIDFMSLIQNGPDYDFYANLGKKQVLAYSIYDVDVLNNNHYYPQDFSLNDNLADGKQLAEIIKRIKWKTRDANIDNVPHDTVLKLRIGEGPYHSEYTSTLSVATLPSGVVLVGPSTYGFIQPDDLSTLQQLIDYEIKRLFFIRTARGEIENAQYDAIINQFKWDQYDIIDQFSMRPRYAIGHKGELYHILFKTADEEALVVRSSELSKAYRMPNAREIKQFAMSLSLNTLKQVEDILMWNEGDIKLPTAQHSFQFTVGNLKYEGAIDLESMGILKISDGKTVRWAEFDSVLYDSLALIAYELND